MKNNKIYITGIGSISALGYENKEIWNNLIDNHKTIILKNDWQNKKIKPTFYGKTPEVNFIQEMNWVERLLPNKYSTLGILACKKAIEDANLQLEETDNEVGLIIETCLAATESVEDYLYDLYEKGITHVRPLKFTKTVANTVLGDVSRCFKLNGPSSLLYNENSINYGFDLIKKGVVDIVICGGVDHFTEFRVLSEQENHNLLEYNLQSNLRETINNTQETKRNLLGDGASFVVLESGKSVKNRNINTYAELVNYHSNFDFKNVDTTHKRQPYILQEAYDLFKNSLQKNKNIVFLSAYTTKAQTGENEQFVLNKLRENNKVHLINHKVYTGDMKAASNVMGVFLSSQILKNNIFSKKQNEKTDMDYAFVSNTHEGGSSSHFLLKQSN